jgi:flagellar basal body-associated protein FliL
MEVEMKNIGGALMFVLLAVSIVILSVACGTVIYYMFFF